MKIYASRNNDIESRIRKLAGKDIWTKVDIDSLRDEEPQYIKVERISDYDNLTKLFLYQIPNSKIRAMERGYSGRISTGIITHPEIYLGLRTIPISWITKIYDSCYTTEELMELIESTHEEI